MAQELIKGKIYRYFYLYGGSFSASGDYELVDYHGEPQLCRKKYINENGISDFFPDEKVTIIGTSSYYSFFSQREHGDKYIYQGKEYKIEHDDNFQPYFIKILKA